MKLPESIFSDSRERGFFFLAASLDPIMPLAQAKEEYQKRYINEILERNNGNRTKTAKDLGVDPRTIFRHLERLDVDKRTESSPRRSDEETAQWPMALSGVFPSIF